MNAPLEVTGELGNLCAARQAELEAARKKKGDREAEIKRLRALNADLLEALKETIALFWSSNSWINPPRYRRAYPDHQIVRIEALIAKAEGS